MDLAVGLQIPFIKNGCPRSGERIDKLNFLMRVKDTHPGCHMASIDQFVRVLEGRRKNQKQRAACTQRRQPSAFLDHSLCGSENSGRCLFSVYLSREGPQALNVTCHPQKTG